MKTRRKFEGNLTLALLAKIYDPAKIDNAQSQALLKHGVPSFLFTGVLSAIKLKVLLLPFDT